MLGKINFFSANVDELEKGYIYDKDNKVYKCLICHELFDEDEVFKVNEKFYNAKKYIRLHISIEHGDMLHYLINQDKKYTGLTENQKSIIFMISQGLDDKAISNKCGCSSSTIRNYRFQFREKEKQAKIQLAIYRLLNKESGKSNESFVSFNQGVELIDERFAITRNEYNQIISSYIKNGKLIQMPTKQKRIIIILKYISSLFKENKKYSEKEVNNILTSVYEDYATIKRYMIDYGFLDRENDCSHYWIKGDDKNEQC